MIYYVMPQQIHTYIVGSVASGKIVCVGNMLVPAYRRCKMHEDLIKAKRKLYLCKYPLIFAD
jgi:hypothetical protein